MLKKLFGFGKKPKANGRFKHGNQHLIEIRQVSKIYESAAGKFTALKSVDLEVDEHEFVAVIGKSGSGKSTLINMITGIDRPSTGEIFVGDTAVHTLNENQMAIWRGRHVGVVFQFFQLLPTLTVIENVMLPMDFCNMYSLRQRKERALHLLAQAELVEHAYKLPAALSGGQQQRAAIARALANDPPILVADEPTGNLDSKTASSVFRLFEGLVDQGKTIVMVTHDNDLAKRATRTIILADGEVVDEYLARALPALTEDQLIKATRHSEPVRFQPGSVIVAQGEPPDKFYVVMVGEVDVLVEQPDGSEVVVDHLGSGQYFGEVALLRGGARTATVRASAHSTVELLALDPEVFKGLMAESEKARLAVDALAQIHLERVEEANNQTNAAKQEGVDV
jgi:ABC-type lipoprotein export system ATPase subunit